MSAVYFHAAMALVNVHEHSMGMGFVRTRTNLRRDHSMHWARRTVLMTFVSNKLYRRLGQQ